jgi:hypothetical protein
MGSKPSGPDARPVTIEIHPLAPAKPVTGAPCNGCGLCCLAEPCPLGMLVSGRRHGRCKALVWQERHPGGRYVCGLVNEPERLLPRWTAPLQRAWQWPLVRPVTRPLGRGITRLTGRLTLRYIAGGSGCDAELERIDPPSQG